MASSGGMAVAWRSLGAGARELRLESTLPTGQSFRWRQTGPDQYTGVVGQRVVALRQLPDDVIYVVLARGQGPSASPDSDDVALRDYFNLQHPGCARLGLPPSAGVRLAELAEGWAKADKRFAAVSPYFPGARMLRQDPVECCFQFICSSNNHISRIHGMVERLCSTYGTPLGHAVAAPAAAAAATVKQEVGAAGAGPSTPGARGLASPPSAAAAEAEAGVGAGAPARSGGAPTQTPVKGEGAPASAREGEGKAGGAAALASLSFFAFPTLEQLAAATEEDLRAAGFGYRARYITGSVAELQAKPEGGAAWLLSLRGRSFDESVEALCTLPGIGPKVAACVALFSLDKHAAIPVDVHVWSLATRYYLPQLRNKTLTPKLHGQVQAVFRDRFGPFCGWAHNALFISDLASQQHRLPDHLRASGAGGPAGGKGRRRSSDSDSGDGGPDVAAVKEDAAGEAAAASPSSSSGDGDGAGGPVTAAGRARGRGSAATTGKQARRKGAAAAAGAGADGSPAGTAVPAAGAGEEAAGQTLHDRVKRRRRPSSKAAEAAAVAADLEGLSD